MNGLRLGIVPEEDHIWKKGDAEWEEKSGDMEEERK